MTLLQGKQLLLGISGGIAAYKAAELTRLLIKAGAQVRVCMTAGAREFITPLTLQALSGQPVHTELLDPEAEAGMGHIELARWADHILIAPCTADLMARLAQGRADDLLTTLCLASPAPLSIAPAMNQQMWKHPATQANSHTLQSRGVQLLGPAQGEQACGDTGFGRMLEPNDMVRQLQQTLAPTPVLSDVHVLITAGPTREPLDPVRYLSNRSSGKMGYAVAAAAHALGAKVTLVSGPVSLPTPAGVTRIDVESAAAMFNATEQHSRTAQIFIATAAVADYTPISVAEQKIKKSSAQLEVTFKRTVDILKTVTERNPHLFSVGFAAETTDLITYAQAKLKTKGLHMIAANSVADGKAFDQEQNALEVLWSDGHTSLPKMDKHALAHALLTLIAEHYHAWKSNT